MARQLQDEKRIPFGKVQCDCGRIVGYLFTVESRPHKPMCAECLRERRAARAAAAQRPDPPAAA